MLRRAAILATTLLILASCATEGDDSGSDTEPTDPTTTLAASTTTSTTSLPAVAVAPSTGWTPVSITDGDTLDVTGPEGTWTVRIIGINTPETGECMFQEATDTLRFITGSGPLTLVSDVTDVDEFGRKLRYLEDAAGIDLGAKMIELGVAIAREYPPDVARSPQYAQLQEAAQAAGVGLWAPDACGPPVDTGAGQIVIEEIRADADGDDNVNLNDEWVRFNNTGTAPVDMTGWIVADESATHRYTFPAFTAQPGAPFTLHTGCGTDTATDLYWCNQDSAVWNNSGDIVFLRDPNGNPVADLNYTG